MTNIKFLLTVDAEAPNAASHPSFRRLCGLIDGHGIAATWMLDGNLMAGAVAGVTGQQDPDATDMVSAIRSMTTPQDMVFMEQNAGARDQDIDPPGSRHLLSDGQLRHMASGFARVVGFRHGLRRAIRTGSDFHLILDRGFLTSTGRSSAFLENILFGVSEHRAAGRIKFATIEEIRRISAVPVSERRETAA